MWEELHIAAGLRLPIVMANANRALSAPINIHCDHSRHHGRARHRLDHLLRRDRAGGLRQHDHGRARRRAPRRDAAGHDHARRLHHHALDRSRRDHGRRDASRRSSATTSPRTRCSTSTSPSTHGNFAGLGGPYFEFKKSQRNAIDRSMAVIKDVGAEWSEALRPPLRRHRGLGHGGRRVRDRRHRLHRRQRASRRPRAARRGRQGRRAQGPRASARSRSRRSPTRSRASRPSRCSTAPSPSAPRAARSSSRSAARSTTSTKRPAIVNYIYGLGGADVKLELMRQVFSDLVDIADGVIEPGRLVYLGAR